MRRISIIIGIVLIFSACEKERHKEELRKFLSFEMDSVPVVAENPGAVITLANLTDTNPDNDIDKLTITATGYAHDQVTITLLGGNEGLKTGLFRSEDGNGMSLFYKVPNLSQVANKQYGTFTFQLTYVQDSLIEGSFYGTLIDTTGIVPPKMARYGFIRAIVKTPN
jgi:hypothetical protein